MSGSATGQTGPQREIDSHLVLALAGIVAAVAVAWIRPALPYQITGPIGLGLLLVAMGCWVWLLTSMRRWSRMRT